MPHWDHYSRLLRRQRISARMQDNAWKKMMDTENAQTPNGDELKHLRDELVYLRARANEALDKATKAITDLESHKKDLERCALEKQRELDHIKAGFPKGDPVGHVQFHERLIRKAEEEAEVFRAARSKLISGGAWAALILIAVSVWEYIKMQVHK